MQDQIQHFSFTKSPVAVATGFTTSFLGDERTLREFIIGESIIDALKERGINAVLYLINDNYDPLSEGALRLGVDKDPDLIREYEQFYGQPIAEVPDPFGCHENYAEHFKQELLKRLHSLEIYPVVLDAYNAYDCGHYRKYIDIVLDNYYKIQDDISTHFKNFQMNNLFRPQCQSCHKIVSTEIESVEKEEIIYFCHYCKQKNAYSRSDVKGKLCWKIDCAARWDLYQIDIEAFNKKHFQELGSYEISSFISKRYFHDKIPKGIRYGTVNIDKDIQYCLLNIFPPKMIKELFLNNSAKDITLNKDFLANFARTYHVMPETDYVKFVTNLLPQLAIREVSFNNILNELCCCEKDIKELIECGNQYSEFFYNKEYNLTLAGTENIKTVRVCTAKDALKLINYSLMIREEGVEQNKIKDIIIEFLRSESHKKEVFPFLRKVFGQGEGVQISTLLATLPADYLKLLQMTLDFYIKGETNEEKRG